MFKRQAHVHSKLAVAVVSALFLSLSAHAGLLGAGGVATGLSGGVIGGMTGSAGTFMAPSPIPTAMPSPAAMPSTAANAAAAAQAAGQTRVQGAFPTRMPESIQQTGQLSGGSAGRLDLTGIAAGQTGAAAAGQASGRQAAAVSGGEDIGQQAQRLTRSSRSYGEIVVEEAADTRAGATDQALRAKQSGEASANASANAAASAAANTGRTAGRDMEATQSMAVRGAGAATAAVNNGAVAASRRPQVSARGSASGSAQASSRDASVSGDASARGSVSN